MNDNEIELLLYRILSGKLIFFYDGEKYELRSPDFSLRYEAQLIYENIINEEKYNDWIREDDSIRFLINLGLWTRDTMTIISDIEKKLENSKVDLYKSALVPDKQKSIRKKINNYNSQLANINNKKVDFLSNTLEGYANAIKNEYLISNTLFKNNKKVFQDTEGTNKNSYTYFNNLVNAINQCTISISQYRELARSQIWRSYWTYNKTDVFHCSITYLTDEQKTLVNVSRMYDSVYDHPESPSDKIIEDDDMLEGWMIIQRRKSEKEKNQKKVDDLNPKLKNAQEVFIMTNNKESYDEVMSLNSEESKYRIKEKVQTIDQKGSVSDSELPDVQRQIRTQATEMYKNRK